MAKITITVPDAKVSRVVAAISGCHPIPTVINENKEEVPEFTQSQWVTEYLRRLIVRTVLSWEKSQQGNAVTIDDAIAS